MGVRFPSVVTSAGLGAPGAAGAEILVLTTPPLMLPLDGATVHVIWYLTVTIGTGTTAATVRLRRGNLLTSPVVNVPQTLSVTAGNTVTFSGFYFDSPGPAAGLQYSMSLAGTGTTGAWTALDYSMLAFVL